MNTPTGGVEEQLVLRWARYLEVHGHPRVPARYRDDDGYRLGAKVHTQRRKCRQGVLDPDDLATLMHHGLAQPSDLSDRVFTRDRTWQHHLNQLRHYKRSHGTANPNQRYVEPIEGFGLGRWLNHQRTAQRQGLLSLGRAAALRDLGVEFDTATLRALGQRSDDATGAYERRRLDTWSKMTLAAERTVIQGRDLNQVHVRTGTPEDPRLGRWLSLARRAARTGTLSEEVTLTLSALGLDLGQRK